MKLQRYIKSTFDLETGEIEVETFNFEGESCFEESEFVKDAIGPSTSKRSITDSRIKLKPEYYQGKKVVLSKRIPICG